MNVTRQDGSALAVPMLFSTRPRRDERPEATREASLVAYSAKLDALEQKARALLAEIEALLPRVQGPLKEV